VTLLKFLLDLNSLQSDFSQQAARLEKNFHLLFKDEKQQGKT